MITFKREKKCLKAINVTILIKIRMKNSACRQIRQLLQDGVIRGEHSPVAGSSDFRL